MDSPCFPHETSSALSGPSWEARCRPQPGPLPREVPYPKGLKGVLYLNDLLDVVGDGRDDLINEVHHAIGGVVVSFQQPSTVDSYNLPREKAKVSKTESESASLRRGTRHFHTHPL